MKPGDTDSQMERATTTYSQAISPAGVTAGTRAPRIPAFAIVRLWRSQMRENIKDIARTCKATRLVVKDVVKDPRDRVSIYYLSV